MKPSGLLLLLMTPWCLMSTEPGFAPWPELTTEKIIWTGDRFVAVGYDLGHGSLSVSSDGLRWQMRDTRFNAESVLFAGDLLFVVTDRNHQLRVSSDELTWERVRLPSSNPGDYPVSIAHGNGRWVLLSSRGELMSSDDGRTWVRRIEGRFHEDSLLVAHGSVVWTGERFVVGRPEVATSTDGIEWLETEIRAYDLNLSGPRLVACGRGQIHTSTDGLNWTTHELDSNELMIAARWNNDTYVAVGSDDSVLTSLDGEIWSAAAPLSDVSPRAVEVYEDGFLVLGHDAVFFGSDGLLWTEIDRERISGDGFYSASNDDTVLFGSQYGARRYRSDRLETILTPSETAFYPGALAATPERLAAVLEISPIVSEDAFEWTRGDQSLLGVVSDGDQILGHYYSRVFRLEGQEWLEQPSLATDGRLVHRGDRLFSLEFYRSSMLEDGVWIELGVGIEDLFYGDERFLALSASADLETTRVLTSETGRQWQEIATIPGSFTRLAHRAGHWYASGFSSDWYGNVSSVHLLTSTDGLTWELLDSDTSAQINGFYRDGDQLYAYGETGTFLRLDGQTVSRVSLPFERNIRDMVRFRDQTVLCLDGTSLQFLDLDAQMVEERAKPDHVIPWVVSNQTWYSRLALLNTDTYAVQVRLQAVARDGSIETEIVSVPPGAVTVAEAGELFPGLNGYALLIGSGSNKVSPSFLTINDDPSTGGQSPSQTTASPLAGLSNELLFGYVPGDELAAVVLVNPEPDGVAVPVTLRLLDQTGEEVATTTVTLEGSQPLASLVRDLFPQTAIPPDAAVVATASPGVLIAGTTFVFNERGQPSMARAFSR